MIISGKTDIGKVRQENQDTWRAGRSGNEFAWAAVCDGMGGERAGKLASTKAMQSVERQFLKVKKEDLSNPLQLLREVVETANREVFDCAVQGGTATYGMGTTIVVALLMDKDVFYAHVGDSRIYLFHQKTLVQLTRDHSRVQEMLEAGDITEQQAKVHPDRNRITRALGVRSQVQVDVGSIPVQQGDEILLCSDGLTNPLSEDMIAKTLSNYSVYQQPKELVGYANREGGQDNITAVVMQVTQEAFNG